MPTKRKQSIDYNSLFDFVQSDAFSNYANGLANEDARRQEEEDRRRFHVTPGGIVVIPKGMKVA